MTSIVAVTSITGCSMPSCLRGGNWSSVWGRHGRARTGWQALHHAAAGGREPAAGAGGKTGSRSSGGGLDGASELRPRSRLPRGRTTQRHLPVDLPFSSTRMSSNGLSPTF
jgi:hypothetical protein